MALQMRECGLAAGSSSLAVKAFQSSMAAAQNPRASEYWDYLEHIEAPQWIDLSVEASLEGTEGDDPWFYQHHPHHETPLEELVFAPSGDFKQESAMDEEFNSTSKEVTSSSEQSLSLESSQERSELKKHENGRLWPSKAKRIQLQPACEIRIEDGKDGKHEKCENTSGSSPSESFSAKLLATLMARLRTNEEVQTASDGNPQDKSLSSSKVANQVKGGYDTDPPRDRTQRVRSSVACMTLDHEGRSKPRRNATGSPLRSNKENASTPTRGKSALSPVKKPKLMNVRKSLATFEFGKNSNGTFSIGRSDGVMAQRRRLSCKSPRLKNSKSLRVSGERKSAKIARVSPDTKETPKSSKGRAYGAAGDDLAAVIAKHNSKFHPKPKYEPRLHSTRDIRQWERRTGQLYYSLQPIERVKVNQDITEFKRSKIL